MVSTLQIIIYLVNVNALCLWRVYFLKHHDYTFGSSRMEFYLSLNTEVFAMIARV